MQDNAKDRDAIRHGTAGFRKGCRACEHTDPDLEREFRAFAQLLLDIHFAKREERRKSDSDKEIDNDP